MNNEVMSEKYYIKTKYRYFLLELAGFPVSNQSIITEGLSSIFLTPFSG